MDASKWCKVERVNEDVSKYASNEKPIDQHEREMAKANGNHECKMNVNM